ncbi:MAG TPA: penicillin-binding protein activator, partial [Myxococcota bacterium]|nr:penicillin-binding protein activator [Myxococcota bacterium]
MTRAAHLVAIVTAALGWLACSGWGPRADAVSETERSDYAQALTRLAEDPAEGERALAAFVLRWPRSPLSGDASIRLAELALERGDRDAALRHYEYVIRTLPHGNRIDSARLGAAAIVFERGNDAAALAALDRVQLRRLSEAEREQASRMFAATARDPVAKLRWLAALRAGERDDALQRRIDAQIDALLAPLDRAELERVAAQLEPEIPAARARLFAAERSLEVGDLDAARKQLESASRLRLETAYASRLDAAAQRLRELESDGSRAAYFPSFADVAGAGLPSTSGARGAIGVVLPLTGDFAPFGEDALRGILLAAGTFDAQRPVEQRPRLRIEIRDSAGSPALAAAGVRELAEQGVAAIIGPLLWKECEAAAAIAEMQRVPLFALTARPEVAASRSYVFRVRTMPSDEVQSLADYATRSLAAKRFGILYPRDAYGVGVSGLFWDAIEARGGQVVALAAYDPQSVDFADSIRRLVGYELLTREEQALVAEREKRIQNARRLPSDAAARVREAARNMLGPEGQPLPPIVDFDALFIPESHEKVALIAPQLAFHEATGATLLG